MQKMQAEKKSLKGPPTYINENNNKNVLQIKYFDHQNRGY